MRFVIRDFHPLVLLYFFGVLGTVAGSVGVLFTLLTLLGPGPLFVRSALSLLLLLVGGISIAVAMAYDLRANEKLAVKYHGRIDPEKSHPHPPEVER